MWLVISPFKPVTVAISTHTSRVGCDGGRKMESLHKLKISTHTSRVGCDRRCAVCPHSLLISTHTSRVGCDDVCQTNRNSKTWYFYSHIPCGMWQVLLFQGWEVSSISTHTSRVGCDLCHRIRNWLYSYFYSHIPCGMWLRHMLRWQEQQHFYSHIPCGMWRNNVHADQIRSRISTHTSRVGCDVADALALGRDNDFYSHIPCGMWLVYLFLQM